MPRLQYFDPPHDMDEVISAIDRDGACIVTGLLAPAFCERLIADFQVHLDQMPWGEDELGYRDEFYGTQTKRLHGLFSKSPHMVDVLMHPFLLALARKLIVARKTARDIRLSNTELMVLGHNQGVQTFHTDGASWYRAQRMDPNETLISANIALTEFTETNGATRVVPGSHLWEADRQPREDEVCLAVMPKGAALIYAGKVIHSGGANEQPAARVGLYLGYVASWLRTLENQLVTNDPKDVLALPAEARQLLDVVPGGFTALA